MENNYSVYQHVTPDGLYYFGQTNNIKKRWGGNGRYYKETSLYPYIEKFGWDNIQHIVLFKEQTRENALWIEDFLITTAQEDGVCINKQRSGLVSKEEEYQREYQREYREKNREQNRKYNREYKREYREKNREQNRKYNREYKREYREKNREKYNEYQREYQRQRYQRKKEEKQFRELGYVPLF